MIYTSRAYTWRVVTEPTSEPISLEEARNHLRVTPDDDSPPQHPDDMLILSLITAARQYCENDLRRALCPQQIEVVMDVFPTDGDAIELPMGPIPSLGSFVYLDGDGIETPMDITTYRTDFVSEPGRLVMLGEQEWPTIAVGGVRNVTLRYWAGYTNENESPNDRPLPKAIKTAMLLLIGHWYENREAVNVGNITTVLDLAVNNLLLPYRLRMPMA